MKAASLCSGIGGAELALSVLGCDLAWHAEIDADACAVHKTHWPDVRNIGDITTADWTQVEPVDVLAAGYPCQPFSLAGSRKGTDDDRHLWPAVRRAVADLRPGWVLLENVRGHLSLGFDGVLGDLAALGFDAAWGVLGSHTVGGCHRRDRLWVVARDATRVAEWAPTSSAANRQSGRVQGVELLPTPTAADSGRRSTGYARGNPTLYGALLPTPTAWLGRRPSQAVGDPERWANPDRSRELSDCIAGENITRGDFGRYTAAVERWAAIHGAAPDPLTVGSRGGTVLNAAFPEWMMGYPAGWASSVVTNTAALRCVGNAIQPQTAAVAWSHLVARLFDVEGDA